jgi:hypothetical protein
MFFLMKTFCDRIGHFAYKVWDKEPQALGCSDYQVEKLEMELKTAVRSYLLAKGQQHTQAKKAAAEEAQSASALSTFVSSSSFSFSPITSQCCCDY